MNITTADPENVVGTGNTDNGLKPIVTKDSFTILKRNYFFGIGTTYLRENSDLVKLRLIKSF